MGAQAWWKSCRERSKSPENDTAIRLNIKNADGSSLDLEGPFTKAEANEIFEFVLKFATKPLSSSRSLLKARKASGPLGAAGGGQ